MPDQHPQGQAGLRALRSAQRRRKLPAGPALSPAARAVPERCGGLVWRRPGPCQSHARCSDEPDWSSGDYDEPDESQEPRELSDSYDLNYSSDPNDHHEPADSGQWAVTGDSSESVARQTVPDALQLTLDGLQIGKSLLVRLRQLA
jgi:hypothetical protein